MYSYCIQSLHSVYWSNVFIGNDRDAFFPPYRCESANDEKMALDLNAVTWTKAVF